MEVISVRSTWRNWDVEIVRGLDRPFAMDEGAVKVMIRRDYLRPWRMVRALIEAFGEVCDLDSKWAQRMSGKPHFLGTEAVTICGEPWRICGCSALGMASDDNGLTFRTQAFTVDYANRIIRVSSRFNAAATAAALVKVVNDIHAEQLAEVLEQLTGGAAVA